MINTSNKNLLRTYKLNLESNYPNSRDHQRTNNRNIESQKKLFEKNHLSEFIFLTNHKIFVKEFVSFCKNVEYKLGRSI